MILLMKVRGKKNNGDLVLERKDKPARLGEVVCPTPASLAHALALLEQFEAALGTTRGRNNHG